ncbi:MAG: hypothetical protein R3208_09645 [Ketobacteraceae bacterium]|nr:hypothetical protein [Ketobacteraceae bacterium]
MGNFVGRQELVMPHEDLDRVKEKVALLDRLSFFRHVFVDLMRMRFSNYERKIDICQGLFNGEGAGTIHRKFDFIELIRKLGYRGPEQVLCFPGQTDDLEKAKALLEKHGCVLCKPKDGQQGIGIFRCKEVADLVFKLENVNQPYIVQEYIPPILDYRYVYHIDPEVTYRFCYKKVRPALYGNGRETLEKLIKDNAELPPSSKKKLIKQLPELEAHKIPEKGKRIELVDSGNVSKGAYGALVTGDELAALDKIMLGLIADLQEAHQSRLTTFCFDLGLLRDNVSADDATKDDYVFYEYQIPFGLSGYITAPEVEENKTRVARLFMGSLQRSWISRKKHGAARVSLTD